MHARYIVLAFLCLLAGVLYLDRICMSQAVKAIQKEFTLNKTQMSYVMMAFTLAWMQSMFRETTLPKALAWFSK